MGFKKIKNFFSEQPDYEFKSGDVVKPHPRLKHKGKNHCGVVRDNGKISPLTSDERYADSKPMRLNIKGTFLNRSKDTYVSYEQTEIDHEELEPAHANIAKWIIYLIAIGWGCYVIFFV